MTANTNPQPDELMEILDKFAKDFASKDDEGRWWGHDTDLGDGKESFAEAHAAITKWAEEVIGPYERSAANVEDIELKSIRNELRAEQRERLRKGEK